MNMKPQNASQLTTSRELGDLTSRPLPINPNSPAPRPAGKCAPLNQDIDGIQATEPGCCDSSGTMNAAACVPEFMTMQCPCPGDPTAWWAWKCQGKENLPSCFWTGDFRLEVPDFVAFRDRAQMRRFLELAGYFMPSASLAEAIDFAGDLLATVNPPSILDIAGNPIVVNTVFSAIKININTPLIQFGGPTSLIVSVGPAPAAGAPAAADLAPYAKAGLASQGEMITRCVQGQQRSPQISLILPLGVVRANQTTPNVLLGEFGELGGAILPFNVRVRGAATGTTVTAQAMTCSTRGIGELARSL